MAVSYRKSTLQIEKILNITLYISVVIHIFNYDAISEENFVFILNIKINSVIQLLIYIFY